MHIVLNVLITKQFFLYTIFHYLNLQILFTYQKIHSFVDIFQN